MKTCGREHGAEAGAPLLTPNCHRHRCAELGGHHQPQNATSPSLGVRSDLGSCPTGGLSLLELPAFALREEETPAPRQRHRFRGDTLQIHSTTTPRTPRQPQIPEMVPLSPVPGPAPAPFLLQPHRGRGWTGSSAPPFSSLTSGHRHGSTLLSCCQPGQGAFRANRLHGAKPRSGGDTRMEVPGTFSASTAPELLSSGATQPAPSPTPARCLGAGGWGEISACPHSSQARTESLA